jgi:aspartyl-tRNA synthetase
MSKLDEMQKSATSTRYTRSQTCGELTVNHLDQTVTLCGWVAKRRDHGGLIFIDLRDRYGVTQIVFEPSSPVFAIAEKLRSEFVLWAKGTVRKRPEGMQNSKLTTGQVEVVCQDLVILSEAKTPPFPIEDDVDVAEQLRLEYRYLDLRRPYLQRNLVTRHKMLQIVRNHLDSHSFLEIETPILYKSTPEGARDFIVPSRLNPGTFYALPQSPQTLKQLLMISGMDRYFQIARCFRDEDLRADRQPEFSQIDIETSFLDEEALFPILEGMMQKLWKQILNVDITAPFPRMPYSEAMDRFGSDKPDVRYGLELQDITSVFAASTFQVFSGALTPNARGLKGSIRAIVVHPQDGNREFKAEGKVVLGADRFSRKDLDDLTKTATNLGAKGLLWIKITQEGEMQSPAAKFFTAEEKAALTARLSLKPGSLVMIVADQKNKVVYDSLGALRTELGNRLAVIPKPEEKKFSFLWVVNFPLLEFDDGEGRYFAAHHPFTSPRPEYFQDFIDGTNMDKIQASAYDMVLNGVEVGGGSLRIYRADVQSAMFKLLGLSEEEAKTKFGFFLEALQYGTPPHGGLAFGVDRLAALLCGVGPIRDVMAFPKTQKGTDLMAGTPSEVSKNQLQELNVMVVKPQAKK